MAAMVLAASPQCASTLGWAKQKKLLDWKYAGRLDLNRNFPAFLSTTCTNSAKASQPITLHHGSQSDEQKINRDVVVCVVICFVVAGTDTKVFRCRLSTRHECTERQ